MTANEQPEPTLRAMRDDDVPRVADILLGYPWTRYGMTRERAERALRVGLDQGATIHVAELDGAPAGFVWWVPRGAFFHGGYIRLIGVSSQHQARGIGHALLSHAEASCAAESSDMFLLVSDFNAHAQNFYARHGYERVGAIPDFVAAGIAEVIMRKRLK